MSNDDVLSTKVTRFFISPLVWFFIINMMYLALPYFFIPLLDFLVDGAVYKGAHEIYAIGIFAICISCAIFIKLYSNFLPSRLYVGSIKYNSKVDWLILNTLSLFLIFCTIVIWIKAFPTRSDRNLSVQIYGDVYNSLKMGSYIILIKFFSVFFALKNKNIRYLWPFILFFIFDFAHGGRTLSVSAIFCVAITKIIIDDFKVSKKWLIISIFFFALLVLTPVITVRYNDSEKEFYILFARSISEFLFTYWGGSAVIMSNTHSTDPIESIIAQFFSALTFYPLPESFAIDKAWGGLSQYFANSTTGLAGNLVAESVYYFGSDFFWVFLLIQPLIIFLILNSCRFFGSPFYTVCYIILISSIQNLARVGFVSGGADILRGILLCLLCYFLYIIVVGNSNRILQKSKT